MVVSSHDACVLDQIQDPWFPGSARHLPLNPEGSRLAVKRANFVIHVTMKQAYELLYILRGEATEEEAKSQAERVHQLLTQAGGTIGKQEFWGKRKLAYEIDHVRQGFYDLVEFDLDSEQLANLEQALRLDEHVLRYQVVRRIVKSPERIAAEERLRERIAAKRAATKEKEAAGAVAAAQPKPTPVAAEPEAPAVTGEQLEEKLEEILDTNKLEV